MYVGVFVTGLWVTVGYFDEDKVSSRIVLLDDEQGVIDVGDIKVARRVVGVHARDGIQGNGGEVDGERG